VFTLKNIILNALNIINLIIEALLMW